MKKGFSIIFRDCGKTQIIPNGDSKNLYKQEDLQIYSVQDQVIFECDCSNTSCLEN